MLFAVYNVEKPLRTIHNTKVTLADSWGVSMETDYSETEDVTVEEIRSSQGYLSLKERIEELENEMMELQDTVESLQRRQDEEMYNQVHESNLGY